MRPCMPGFLLVLDGVACALSVSDLLSPFACDFPHPSSSHSSTLPARRAPTCVASAQMCSTGASRYPASVRLPPARPRPLSSNALHRPHRVCAPAKPRLMMEGEEGQKYPWCGKLTYRPGSVGRGREGESRVLTDG